MQEKATWKDFYGYKISNKGRVISKRGKIKKCRADKDGYLRTKFYINGKIKLMHVARAVLMVFKFNSNYNNLTANHLDGNKLNNSIDNLEWCTPADNNKHAYLTGLKNNKGENNPRCKRTLKDINEIRRLWRTGKYTQQRIADMFNTTQNRISEIINRKMWNY